MKPPTLRCRCPRSPKHPRNDPKSGPALKKQIAGDACAENWADKLVAGRATENKLAVPGDVLGTCANTRQQTNLLLSLTYFSSCISSHGGRRRRPIPDHVFCVVLPATSSLTSLVARASQVKSCRVFVLRGRRHRPVFEPMFGPSLPRAPGSLCFGDPRATSNFRRFGGLAWAATPSSREDGTRLKAQGVVCTWSREGKDHDSRGGAVDLEAGAAHRHQCARHRCKASVLSAGKAVVERQGRPVRNASGGRRGRERAQSSGHAFKHPALVWP